jgi:hypothetical protein
MTDVTIHGITMTNVHHESECAGRHCIVHRPLHTHMDNWPVIYRYDRGIFERLDVLTGIGHPDPSQFDYWAESGQMHLAAHGCDGACALPPVKYRVEKDRLARGLGWLVRDPDGKIVWHSSSQQGAFHMAEVFVELHDSHRDLRHDVEAHPWH